MVGSVIDGEDVVQDALLKAFAALDQPKPIANPESWLFRIAHNSALDFLRRRNRADALRSSEDPEMLVDPVNPVDDPEIVAASLTTFMRLPVGQRSSVILMDVLGYRLGEICNIMDCSLPAAKSALNRGRTRLRELAREPEGTALPVLGERDRSLLWAYIDRFNARDFTAIRDMLADEVRLDLVNKVRKSGRDEVSTYVENYADVQDWQFVLGFVERRPAIIVRDPSEPSGAPAYFILLEWSAEKVLNIRDFRYARYAIESAHLQLAN
jgi:RNA polymerase sigma-70 factor (ECF subfamily)